MQQAIAWANADPDLYRHMASLGHNKFNAMAKTINVIQLNNKYKY